MLKKLDEDKINGIINSIDSNFNEILEIDLVAAYNYVLEKLNNEKHITQPQYKFICWLNANNYPLFVLTLNKPTIPKIIK
ncbi:MAG: hypothetical protein IPJ26_15370 [Bacteroidetes bacterium]|nr:hypothetical protein [Bacteroidota bacterium]